VEYQRGIHSITARHLDVLPQYGHANIIATTKVKSQVTPVISSDNILK
jgi:hypothetical protein